MGHGELPYWGRIPTLSSMCLGTSFLGHFMGKKSLEPLSPSPTGTAPHTFPRDQELQLSHDLLRSLLLRRALGLSSPAPHTQVSQATLHPEGGQPQEHCQLWKCSGVRVPCQAMEWVCMSGF